MIESLTRRIWGCLLWISRRPTVKKLQRLSVDWAPPSRRERARQALRWQNRLGLRYGRMIVRISVVLLVLSFGLTTSYLIVLEMANRGVFTITE